MELSPSSRLLANCPLCQAVYADQEVRLISERGMTRLFHCTCHTCGHAMLAIILETHGSISSVGLVTDLEAQDVVHYKDARPLSGDDCIRAHKILEEESSDFCKLLLKAS